MFKAVFVFYLFETTPDQVLMVGGVMVLIWFVLFLAWEWCKFIDPTLRYHEQIYFDPQYQWRRRL